MISILRHPSFNINTFKDHVYSLKSCQDIEKDYIGERIARFQFTPSPLQSGMWKGYMYIRPFQDFIRTQVALVHSSDICLRPDPHDLHYTRSIRGAKVTSDAHAFLRAKIMQSEHAHRWNERPSDMLPQSFVGLLQMYSDKSASSLKAHSIASHPAHLALMNIGTKTRERLILGGFTIAAFLPCDMVSTHIDREQPHATANVLLIREDRLKLIQESVQLLLQQPTQLQTYGIDVETADNKKLRLHPILVSCVLDIPEGKALTATKGSVSTVAPCSRCYIPKQDLVSNVSAEKRTLDDTIRIRAIGADDALDAVSLQKVPSFLEHSTLLIPTFGYDIWRYEPLHNLHLGMSHILKTCTLHLIETLGSRRQAVLRYLNDLLIRYSTDSYVPGLYIDFRSGDRRKGVNGFFVSDGVRGMLEAKDYWAVDQVFPFLALSLDRMMAQTGKYPLTKVHTMYTAFVHAVKNSRREGRASADTLAEEARENISRLKEQIRYTFTGDTGRALHSLKFHLLEHLPEDIATFGALHHMDAGPYDKPTDTGPVPFEDNDGMRMVQQGVSTTLKDLRDSIAVVQAHMEDIQLVPDYAHLVEIRPDVSAAVLGLIAQLGDQGLVTLVQRLDEMYPNHTDVAITYVKSGYVQGGFIPGVTDVNTRNRTVIPPQENSVAPQRVIATAAFGSGKRPIYSDVLVKGNDGLWVARVRALFRCQPMYNGDVGEEVELCFVQYYEYSKPLDGGERALDAVTLRWSTDDETDHSRTEEDYREGHELPAPWYGLESAEAVRGVVHVVRLNYEVSARERRKLWFQHRFCINPFVTPRVT